MTRPDTQKEILALLAGILGVGDDAIEPETVFTRDNGIEGVDVAKLIIACEKRFRITILDENVHALRCAVDLAAYVENLLDEGTDDMALHDDEERGAWYYER